jgi:hypothetical protein
MNSKVGLGHCERCGRPFTIKLGLVLLNDEAQEQQECKQAGFCSAKCLYEQEREDNNKVTREML